MARLLVFNLATDADDPVLGFTTVWLQEFAKRVEFVDVVTMRAGRLDLPENVRVYSLGKEKGYSEPRRLLEFYRILFCLLTTHHYDGCFAHMMPLFAAMSAPLLRLKRIPMTLWYTHKSVTWMLRTAVFFVDSVVTASQESFRLNSRKVRVIGHGIDTKRFTANPSHKPSAAPFTILSVSRLSAIKRLDLLIDAVARLHQRQPELSVRVKIVGGALTVPDQEYATALKRQVEQSHLQEIVEFIGDVPFHRIVPFYQQADCFVNLCLTGGMDKAVLEAMSCEVPVIVANQTFAPVLGAEIAKIWLNDWEADSLAEQLRYAISLAENERRELGKYLRNQVMQHHNLAQLIERLLSVLHL